MLTLPRPDLFGNYWLDQKPCGPVVFPSKCVMDGHAHDNGYLIASLGTVRGLLWDGAKLRKFDTPAEAMAAINERYHLAAG